MNFLEAAYQVVSHHPIASVGGVVVSAAVLWKGAKSALKRIHDHFENRQEIEGMKARLPAVKSFVPPGESLHR